MIRGTAVDMCLKVSSIGVSAAVLMTVETVTRGANRMTNSRTPTINACTNQFTVIAGVVMAIRAVGMCCLSNL
jgi:hypothetical protein